MSTSIEWTDVTWNPVTGCTKVSPGCAHCYIERTPAFRTKRIRFERGRIPVQLHPDRLAAPLHWRQPRRVFVNSMSDLFHEDVPDEFIDQVFAVMALAGGERQKCKAGTRCWHEESPGCCHLGEGRDEARHTFQVLTKRPERMREYLATPDRPVRILDAAYRSELGFDGLDEIIEPLGWPLPNVWLGVSVENQRMFDQRVPLLLDTPATVRFLSCEPLLGPIELHADMWPACSDQPTDIHWVIVGGESGPTHRPFDPDWARALRDQCRAAGVPMFMKQLGGARPGSRLEDLPEDLRIREFPA